MTKRGLIIGTSHSAALRLAWKAWSTDWPAMTLDFAALHGSVADLVVTGQSLTGRHEANRQTLLRFSGQAAFDLAAYDFIALCGGTTSSFHAVRLYLAARWPGLPSTLKPLGPGLSLLSARCFQAALIGQIRSAPAFPLLTAIRASGIPARLYAIPLPALSHAALTQSKQHQGFVRLHRNGDHAAMAAVLNAASVTAYDGLATYVPPPPEVRKDDFFTRARFRRGATRLGTDDTTPQPKDDFLHDNAEYGRYILTGLAALL